MLCFSMYKHILIYLEYSTLSLERHLTGRLPQFLFGCKKKCVSLYCNNMEFEPKKELERLMTDMHDVSIHCQKYVLISLLSYAIW